MGKFRVFGVILLTLTLASCQQDKDVTTMEPLPPQTQEAHPTSLIQENGPTMEVTSQPSPDLENLVEKVKGDLAQRLSIPVSQINLSTAIEVTWPDSSLGCPQPDGMYIQILTDGFLIRLEVNGNIYEYHTDASGQFVLCENPQLPIIPVTPGEIDDGEPWVPVN